MNSPNRKQFLLAFSFLSLALLCLTISSANAQWDDTLPFIEVQREDLGYIWDIRWQPNNQLLAVAAEEGVVLLDENLQQVLRLKGDIGEIYSVDWNADGSKLASAGVDGDIRIWDMDQGNPTYGTTIKILEGDYQIISAIWSPVAGDDRIASLTTVDINRASDEAIFTNAVKIWDVSTGQTIQTVDTLNRTANRTAWSDDAQYVAMTGFQYPDYDSYKILVWDSKTGQLVSNFDQGYFHRSGEILWGPSPTLITIAGYEIYYTDSLTSKLLNKFDWIAYINSMDWSPDRKLFVTGDDFNTLTIWDSWIFRAILVIDDNPGEVYSVDWCADGQKIASVANFDTIRIWDVSNLPDFSGTPTFTPFPTTAPTATATPHT